MIVSYNIPVCVEVYVRVQESSPLRIVVSDIQIVKSGLFIIPVSPVAERAVRDTGIVAAVIVLSGYRFSPRVVGEFGDLVSAPGEDVDYVALNVLPVYVVVKYTAVVCRVPVPESDRASLGVINVDHQVLDGADGPFFTQNCRGISSAADT